MARHLYQYEQIMMKKDLGILCAYINNTLLNFFTSLKQYSIIESLYSLQFLLSVIDLGNSDVGESVLGDSDTFLPLIASRVRSIMADAK